MWIGLDWITFSSEGAGVQSGPLPFISVDPGPAWANIDYFANIHKSLQSLYDIFNKKYAHFDSGLVNKFLVQ